MGGTREGDLKNTASYPPWLQEVLLETGAAKSRVSSHPLFPALPTARRRASGQVWLLPWFADF